MAETPFKRQREEPPVEDGEESKRHKSYNHILSLLEADEDEPSQDPSSLITSLQQVISSDSGVHLPPCPPSETDPDQNPTTASAATDYSSSSPLLLKVDEEDDKNGVMRHLFEASDDELGIPHRDVRVDDGEGVFNNGDCFPFYDGLWELEDEAANYYALLQSELFM